MLNSTDPTPLSGDSIDGQALAAFVAGKLCHDFISPSGAILSGLDLLSDPSAADMRDDAMALIQQSAGKLAALVQFYRVAFGAATTAERFTGEGLGQLVADVTKGGRSELDWAVAAEMDFDKPAARALVNLAYLTQAALPTGGRARIQAERAGGDWRLSGVAEGNRARLKPEALTGLSGERLTEGLAGQWVQSYWLWLTVTEPGGDLTVEATDGRVDIRARMPVAAPAPNEALTAPGG